MYSWWLLVMESGSKTDETSYTTDTRFHHLQVGATSHYITTGSVLLYFISFYASKIKL
jgi:hypothetical protein